jgi:hypothetical protein
VNGYGNIMVRFIVSTDAAQYFKESISPHIVTNDILQLPCRNDQKIKRQKNKYAGIFCYLILNCPKNKGFHLFYF